MRMKNYSQRINESSLCNPTFFHFHRQYPLDDSTKARIIYNHLKLQNLIFYIDILKKTFFIFQK